MTSAVETRGSRALLPRSDRGTARRRLRWVRENLFSSIFSSVISLVLIFLLAGMLFSLVQWGIWDAIWSVPGNNTSACRAIRGIGACWAVIPEKIRFILFGSYTYDQQWRPAAATLIFIPLFFFSSTRTRRGGGAG